MDKVNVGDKIKIITMQGEPQYTNREGVVTHIDDAGQIHGTWGGCAVIPSVDTYIIIDRLSFDPTIKNIGPENSGPFSFVDCAPTKGEG